MNFNKISILLTLFFIALSAYPSPSDSLKQELENKQGTAKLKVYDQLIHYYIDHQIADSAALYARKSLDLAEKLKIDTTIIKDYSYLFELSASPEEAKKLFNSALSYYAKRNDSIKGLIYFNYGDALLNYNRYIEAIDNYKTALKYFTKDSLKAQVYLSIGYAYKNTGNLDSAVTYYQKALKIAENKLHDIELTASLLNNIALVHKQLENYDISLEYFKQIIEKTGQIKDSANRIDFQARTYLNMALVENLAGKHQEALQHSLKAKELFQSLNSDLVVYAFRNAALSYIDLKQYEKAIQYLDSALNRAEENYRLVGNIYYLMAKAELAKAKDQKDLNSYYKAIDYGNKAVEILKQTRSIYLENKTYAILYQAYAAVGNYKKAFEAAVNYIKTNEIIFNEEKTKAIQEMETKYQAEKKQQEIEKQRLIIEKQTVEVKRQRMQRNALIAIVFLMAALAYVAFRSYQQKKRDNMIIQQKNKELEQAYEEIRVQRDQLQEQKDKIQYLLTQLQDSIHYAERIQNAAMPAREMFDRWFDEYFIFFRPREIVSGDFYWAKLIRGRYLAFTVADCTGHGVPGAFVSMLGISLLNEITQRSEIITASQVLEEMRKAIKESLKQSHAFEDSKDGMDIAFCVYDKQTKQLQFAGANNPMYFIRNGELTVYDAVKNPVAIYIREKPFKTHYIDIQPGDTIYLSSDGFYDQPGGAEGKKYMRKRFKEFLLKIWNKPMKEQERIFEQEFEQWKNGYKQIDDVCVMGVRFES